jgi:sn-glycerol 3-phosphate transport system ATP-binding protein
MSRLVIRGLVKRFGGPSTDSRCAVSDIAISVDAGKCLALVGPTGCGKTTTLRLIAGLETPDSGGVFLDGIDITQKPPGERSIAMVFQTLALYPHLTVRENVQFPLQIQSVLRRELDQRTTEIMQELEIDSLSDRLPEKISGGERQRVALARAVIQQPAVFLLDEPFTGLDAPKRQALREHLRRFQKAQRVAVIHVTHDQSEALALGNEIALMREGHLEQMGKPDQVYAEPASTFVASFLGTPPMNLLKGRIESSERGLAFVPDTPTTSSVQSNRVRIPLSPNGVPGMSQPVVLGIRAESISAGPHQADSIPMGVVHSECCGSDWSVWGTLQGQSIVWRQSGPEPLEGSTVWIRIPSQAIHWFDVVTGKRL